MSEKCDVDYILIPKVNWWHILIIIGWYAMGSYVFAVSSINNTILGPIGLVICFVCIFKGVLFGFEYSPSYKKCPVVKK